MMTGQNLLRLSALAALGLITQGAAGAVLVSYNFGTAGQETTSETSPAFAPTSFSPDVTATAIQDTSNKVGIEISSAATAPASAPFNRVDPQGSANSQATAVSNGAYFSYTVTPVAGKNMSLTDFQFDVMRGGGSTPRGYVVRSSANNFATDLSAADVATVRPTFTHVNIDLTGASFQNLTDPLTFRIYVFSTGAGSSVDFDNFALNGTTAAAPEPATFGLAGVAATGLLARRSRRARA
jgi:hypothetical protein